MKSTFQRIGAVHTSDCGDAMPLPMRSAGSLDAIRTHAEPSIAPGEGVGGKSVVAARAGIAPLHFPSKPSGGSGENILGNIPAGKSRGW